MSAFATMQQTISQWNIPPLLIIGVGTGIAFYFGKIMKYIKLPSIIGFMIIGVILGPSLFDFVSEPMQENLAFITEIALSFVALSIGLELKFSTLKKQGVGIILIILAESFGAFLLVTGAVYLLTKNLPMALLFGGIAPASAPAGTVAVIREFKAKGPLTEALYAVVGFDDGLGIIIFGFAAAIARQLISVQNGIVVEQSAFMSLMVPLKEVVLSLALGGVFAFLVAILVKRVREQRDVLIILFVAILVITGLSSMLHLSIILTNMVVGIVFVNTQSSKSISMIKNELGLVLPLLFVMFFMLAGANLHINALPSLGLLGLVYILARSTGLVSGSKLGAWIGKSDKNIRKYLGMGILSQAGVAIGLALIVKHEFGGMGAAGAYIGATVITTVTATSLVFEIVGPILTKIGLKKSGETNLT